MKDFDAMSDTIVKYLQGQLSGEELEAFLAKLKNAPDLKSEVEFRKQLMSATVDLGQGDLRDQ